MKIPDDIHQQLQDFGQEHILYGWDHLSPQQQQDFLQEIRKVDLQQICNLYGKKDVPWQIPPREKIQPVPVAQLDPENQELKDIGNKALADGQVATLVVAGGQGTRLGFDPPKGMYPIGPLSHKSLFQLFAEKIQALSDRFQVAIPFLVMTSPATDEPTREFFADMKNFGLGDAQIKFFCQGTMPAVDFSTGKLLLDQPGKLATSPNGHGGTVLALWESGLLDELKKQGIQHLFYFQVDNPLVVIADPLFLGHHILNQAEVSSKVIAKKDPTEKLGNLVLVDGRCTIIEYSDLPEDMAHERDSAGNLRFGHGNPAIHIFDVDFLRRVMGSEARIPFHLAKKKVPYVDDQGNQVNPAKENAIKFEMFIFDLLPLAERWTAVETTYAEEFAPVKNAEGAHSPETAKQAMMAKARRWLRQAGHEVPDDLPVEISPLVAIEPDDLRGHKFQFVSPLYIE